MDSQQVRNLQEAYMDVYDNLDEAYTPGPTQAEIRRREQKQREKQVADAANQSGYGDKPSTDWKLRVTPSTIDRKGRTVSQRMNMSHDYKNRLTGEMGRKYGSRQAAEVTRTIEGPGEPQSVTYPRKTKPSREIVRKNLNNSYDLYDIILSHLLDEGYADTQEAAEVIMVNMSEEWRESIVEEVLDEGEKPFPYEKVKEKQVALRNTDSAGLDRRMKMGMAVRRAKEAGEKGGSQQDAGKDWYHGK